MYDAMKGRNDYSVFFNNLMGGINGSNNMAKFKRKDDIVTDYARHAKK